MWKGYIIDKHISKEVLKLFLISTIIITIIMISNFLFELSDWLIIDNIEFNVVLKVLFYKLPSIVVDTFPLAVLFACISAISNLNDNNEIVAITMGGINRLRLLVPLIIIGLILSGATFMLNEIIIPKTNHKSNQLIRKHMVDSKVSNVQEGVFFKGEKNRVFFIDNYNKETRTLNEVMIYNKENNKSFPPLITAEKGTMRDSFWILENGSIYGFNKQGKLSTETSFNKMKVVLFDDMSSFLSEQKNTSEMTRNELKEKINLFLNSGLNVQSLLVDYHMKISKVLTPLIFMFLGFSLSVGFKNNKVVNMIIIVCLIFIYYLVSSLSRSLGVNGNINSFLAAWFPQISFTLISLLVYFFKDKLFSLIKTKIILKFFIFIILITFFITPTIQAETIKIEANNSSYDSQTKEYKLSKDVFVNYNNNVNLKTDQIVVKSKKDNLSNIEEVKIKENIFSGCSNKDHFHYYFKAQKTIIYPNDYLVAYNVVLWEFGGNIPIFYSPVLYIPLKDSSLNFDYGIDKSRGHYLGFAYNYLLNDLPGASYLKYYTKSGFKGGFKQYLLYNMKNKFYFKYLGQEDKNNLDLYNHFVETSYEYNNDNLNINLNNDFYDYNQKTTNSTLIDFKYSNKKNRITLKSNIYNKENKKNTDIYKKISNSMRMNYYLKDNLKYFLSLRERKIINGLKKNKLNWNTYLEYDRDKIETKLEFEEYQPRYQNDYQERKIAFSKKPELIFKYKINRNLNYNFIGGYYSEENLSGERYTNQLDYNYSYNLNKYIDLKTIQKYDINYFKIDNSKEEKLFGYKNKYSTYKPQYQLNLSYNNLYFKNNYRLIFRKGYAPFSFDKEKYSEALDLDFGYENEKFDFKIDSRYDFDIENFKYINLNSEYKTNTFNLDLSTGYNFKYEKFYDLKLKTEGKLTDNLMINSELRYDLNNKEFKNIDSEISYSKENDLSLNYEIDYDILDEEIDKNKISLTKDLHCREISFNYDFKRKKYFFEYSIDFISGFSYSNSN